MRAFACAAFIVLTAAVCVSWAVAPTPAVVPTPDHPDVARALNNLAAIAAGYEPFR